MKKRFFCLFLFFILTWTLCACGGQAPSPETLSPSAPAEEAVAVETILAETEPAETVPQETEPVIITVKDVSYDSRLGEPVLEEAALAELVDSADIAAAAEQISTVGDAVCYMKAVKNISDSAELFMTLLANDYDEIGLIELSSPTSRNHYVYIGQDGVFYPFNPWDIPEGHGILWPEVPASGTDLDVLCEIMMTTCPFTRDGEPMTACGHMALYAEERINVSGIPYAAALGKPTLDEETLNTLSASKDTAAAAEQINNAGDAIRYIKARAHSLNARDGLRLFADLLENDYDEVGFIHFTFNPYEGYHVAYIGQDGVFYPFDVYQMVSGGGRLWFSAPESDIDLNALGEALRVTCPYTRSGETMVSYETELSSSAACCKAGGILYPAVLGQPVLGTAAAELAKSQDALAAAEQITNIGDAISYMKALPRFQHPEDACNFFAGLLAGDYDSVGLLWLLPVNHHYNLVYLEQDGVFYPFDPFTLNSDDRLWPSALESDTDLDTLSKRLMTSCPYGIDNWDATSYTIDPRYTNKAPVTPEERAVAYLTTPQYTKEQIEQWVADGLTVEQWAEKIKVPADATALLQAIHYRYQKSRDNVFFQDTAAGRKWTTSWNAQESFSHQTGACGGTSNLMNFLLSGDFDEQGYVAYNTNNSGHILNYFVCDGIYVMCDFVNLFAASYPIYPNTQEYIVYAGTDVQAFGDWYRTKSTFAELFEEPREESYLYQMWLYPREGTQIPKGSDGQSKRTPHNNVVWDILPEEYREEIVILYEREEHPLRFLPILPQEQWPDTIR